MKRRDFIKVFGLASGGFILGCNVTNNEIVVNSLDDGISFVPNLFIQLQKDGKVTVVVTRSEMGQGIRTSMALAIADEMEADWNLVSVKQATGDAKFGNQNTDGSRSIRTLLNPMRKMGAMARLILEKAAAKKWEVDYVECKADHHQVKHISGKVISFSNLVGLAKQIPIPKEDEIILKEKKNFKYIGKSLTSIDINDFTHGKALYGLDARLPNMKFAAIARCPVPYGKVKDYKDTDAKAIKGVEKVLELPSIKPGMGQQMYGMFGGVAVIANNTWSAFQGKNNLQINWEFGKNQQYQSEEFCQKITQRVQEQAKVVPPSYGNVNNAFKKADKIIEATYTMPHMVHAPMEVPNALAWVQDGKCEVWAPVQDPQTARSEIATFFNFRLEDVTINVTLLGGGFGRKSKSDFVVEAVALSKEMKAPVQVVWTREDDIQNGYYHAQSAQYFKGSLDNFKRVSGWLHRSAFPSITSLFKPISNYAAGFELGQGFTNNPYNIPNIQIENAKAEAYMRIGWLRSVYNIISGFGINSFVDELAVASGKDGIDFRMDLLGHDREISKGKQHTFSSKRFKNVLQKAKEISGWGKQLPQNHGIGVAIHYSFYSYVASVVEVEVRNNKVNVKNIWQVLDCGMYVNKDSVINQMEGAAIFGMSIALFNKISTKDGRVVQSNFHDYPMTRMQHTPNIVVEIIENDFEPTGVGEPGVPPIAPAICNAIFNATGKRIRKLPLSDSGWA